MIWEPFVLAVVLGLVISAGLYFAYLWPSVEPLPPSHDDGDPVTPPAAPSDLAAGQTAELAPSRAGPET